MPKQTSARKSSKTVVRSTKNSFKKWQLGLAAVVVLVLVGGLGTYLYTQQQKKDIQAKAGAFKLRPQDYEYKAEPTMDLAVCKTGGNDVRFIYTIELWKWYLLRMDREKPISTGAWSSTAAVNGTRSGSSFANGWYRVGNHMFSSITIRTSNSYPWVKALADLDTPPPYSGQDGFSSKYIHRNFIPYC